MSQLPLLLWLLIFISLVAFISLLGSIAIVLSVLGRMTVRRLIKSNSVKLSLLFVFFVLLIIGIQSMLPIVDIYVPLSTTSVSTIRDNLALLLGLFTVSGLYSSTYSPNTAVKVSFIVVFLMLCSMAVGIIYITSFFS